MPFGLKIAPSLFQKVMTKIFSPIQDYALNYLDDILLFSISERAHTNLLVQFHNIVKAHGIMLFEKKMLLDIHSIEFLGMKITDDTYVPQPHIVIYLDDFPDENLTIK